MTPILYAAPPAALAVGYGIFKWRRNVNAANAAAAAAMARTAAQKAAYAAGAKDGKSDGIADIGKTHNPRPTINAYPSDPSLQQQFENGYNDAYEKHWVPPPAIDPSKDSTPSAGGAKGLTPRQYGCSRGSSSGYADAEAGYSRDSWETNLKTAGSIKRQAESGDPAAYREGYKACYIGAWDGYWVGKKSAEPVEDWESERKGTFGFPGSEIVSGLAHVVSGFGRGSFAAVGSLLDTVTVGGAPSASKPDVSRMVTDLRTGKLSVADATASVGAFEKVGDMRGARIMRDAISRYAPPPPARPASARDRVLSRVRQ